MQRQKVQLTTISFKFAFSIQSFTSRDFGMDIGATSRFFICRWTAWITAGGYTALEQAAMMCFICPLQWFSKRAPTVL